MRQRSRGRTRYCSIVLVAVGLVAGGLAVPVVAGAQGLPVVSIGDASVHEGDGGKTRSLKFAVTLSESSASEVVVSYVVSGDTAIAPADFNDSKGKTRTLKFKPGRKSGVTPTSKFVNVAVNPDTDVEGDEQVTVTITAVTGADIGDGQAMGTIIDDDPSGGPTLSIGDASVYEGDAGTTNKVQLWVTLSEPVAADFTFDVAVTGGTATAGTGEVGDDFKVRPTKTVTMKAGKWKKPVTLQVYPDTSAEDDETIEVTVSSGAVAVGDATGVATIVDDDGGPVGPDEFAIAVGDVVSDGVPAAGAGNIEAPGAQDVYTFDATAGQQLFVDVLTDPCPLVDLEATLTDPNGGTVYADRDIDCGSVPSNDFGPFDVSTTGTFTLTVGGPGGATGTYSFTIREVPDVEEFTIGIGDVVSDGVPAAGAGNIESPGARDVYTFTATAGQNLFVDVLTDPCTLLGLRATLVDPNGNEIYADRGIDCGTLTSHDFGPFLAPATGTYTLDVGASVANDDVAGTYSFTIVEAPLEPDEFAIAIGDVVGDGVPGAGAGNIEAPGAEDIYTFTATAGQRLFLDVLTDPCTLVGLDATLLDPNDVPLFSARGIDCGNLSSQDFGPFTVSTTGTFTLVVDAPGDTTGTYSFTFLEVPAPDEFAIAIGDVVSDGVPAAGAGNIEVMSAEDVYTFTATAGQRLFVDVRTNPCSLIGLDATLLDPTATPLYSNRRIDCGSLTSQDFGPFVAPATGTYTLTVGGSGNNSDTIGTYSFVVLTVADADEFPIAIGDVVANGSPAAGAGNIEAPGAQDIYTFDAVAGQDLFVDVLTAPCSLIGLRATLLDPNDVPIFTNRGIDCGNLSSHDFGPFTVATSGTFTLVVGGLPNDDTVGTYSFTVTEV